jgi:DNA polymerase-2
VNDPRQVAGPGEPAFLLTRDWRDTRDGIELTLWARTAVDAVRLVVTTERAVCFIERAVACPNATPWRKPVALSTPDGAPVDALYFRTQAALRDFAEPPPVPRRHLYETDLRPVDRYLMERFVQGPLRIHGSARRDRRHRSFIDPHLGPGDFRPSLSVVSLDIETDYASGRLYSIGVSGDPGECVFLNTATPLTGADGDPPLVTCKGERALLERFLDYIEDADPDVIIGWNVVGFDLSLLETRCRALGVPFCLGRERGIAHVIPGRGPNPMALARVPGRVVMDGIESLRGAFYNFESFSLDHVASELLGRGKLVAEPAKGHRGEEIQRLYTEDPVALARYNLEDCRLVAEIFHKTDLVNFSVERAASTGLALGRPGGSVAAFDFLYLPRLHRRGFVAPDSAPETVGGLSSPGGYVLDSLPGLYNDVLVLDFKSLYPSIIRTYLIDPMASWLPGEPRVAGFEGASFNRDRPILPEIIDELWRRRDEAKRLGNAPLSQAVKIIMNSFYGVLGASACRFFDTRLTSSITRRGHEVIRRSRAFIEERGLTVIYGDTDSLFVWLEGDPTEAEAAKSGHRLAAQLNAFWRDTIREEHDLDSFLEIEFETHYLRFLMPTVRGSGAGSKKRYAGMVRRTDGDTALVFRGLETVRSDWTRLAREFQQELFRRVFNDEPYDDYVRSVHAGLYRGEFDDKLVYRKQLRQALDRYRRNVPPHVQAARKLSHPGRYVEYVICPSGPEPLGGDTPPPDHDHYSERQLKPVADTILHAIGTSYDEIVGGQFELFS